MVLTPHSVPEMLLNRASGRGEEKALVATCPRRPETFSLVSTRSQGLSSCSSGWCSGHLCVGSPCQGLFPRTILGTAFCLSLRESGSCLSDREARGLGQQSQHTLGPAYKIVFPNTQTLHAPYQASRWQSPVAGQCRFICTTSARRPV